MWVCMQVEATAKSVLGLYQQAIASADLLPSDKEDLSARACTFADMCGSAAMQEAAERLHAARSDPKILIYRLTVTSHSQLHCLSSACANWVPASTRMTGIRCLLRDFAFLRMGFL